MGEEDDNAKAKIGFPEVLKELAVKIKDEILILAFAFALIFALVVATAKELDIWIGITFIVFYTIAIVCYLAKKSMETRKTLQKDAMNEGFKWTVLCPPALPKPSDTAKENVEIVHFPLKFIIRNLSSHVYSTRVYVKSNTQAIGFVLDPPVKTWKRHHAIIPYREDTDLALDSWIVLKMNSKSEENFNFQGIYRPNRAWKDITLKNVLLIQYRLYATSENQRWLVDSGLRRLELPFKDKVRLSKRY